MISQNQDSKSYNQNSDMSNNFVVYLSNGGCDDVRGNGNCKVVLYDINKKQNADIFSGTPYQVDDAGNVLFVKDLY